MSTIALAQRDLGTITGTITDQQGAAVPNAKITISQDGTGVTYDTVSNDTGNYTRPALTPGTYTVTAIAPGFQKTQQGNIIVTPGEPVAVNLALRLGNA
jgi:protocatechuate 3,4-dioxygenase beta subunit